MRLREMQDVVSECLPHLDPVSAGQQTPDGHPALNFKDLGPWR